ADAVVLWFQHVEGEAARHGGIDGVAALVEHALPGPGREVVAGCDDAVRAHVHGPRREWCWHGWTLVCSAQSIGICHLYTERGRQTNDKWRLTRRETGRPAYNHQPGARATVRRSRSGLVSRGRSFRRAWGASLLRRRQLFQRFPIRADGAGGDEQHPFGIEVLRGHVAHVVRGDASDGPAVVVEEVQAEAVALDVDELGGHAGARRQLERQAVHQVVLGVFHFFCRRLGRPEAVDLFQEDALYLLEILRGCADVA